MLYVLLVVLLILMIAGAPQFTGSLHNFGWGPSGLSLLLIIVLIILLMRGGV